MKKVVICSLLAIFALAVAVFAADTDYIYLSSPDGETTATGSLSVIWAWFDDDYATATLTIDASSNIVDRGVFVSLFGYKNGSVVCSGSSLDEITTFIIRSGNCSIFRSFHAITANGNSNTSLGVGASGWIQVD
jgi:hypothetical protein